MIHNKKKYKYYEDQVKEHMRMLERKHGYSNINDREIDSPTDKEGIVVYPPLHIVGRYWISGKKGNYHSPTPPPFTFEVLAKVGNKWISLYKSTRYYDTPDGYHLIEGHKWISRHNLAPPRILDENGKEENLWRWMQRNNITVEKRIEYRRRDL